MFINLSNHPSAAWDPNQMIAAEKYGKVVDLRFPDVSPESGSREIDLLVDEYLSEIMEYDDPVVMVQGEFVFTYRMVTALKARGIKAVAATTGRVAEEERRPDGTVIKTSKYKFSQFREY